MRNHFKPYRIEPIGTFTKNGFDYHAERHYTGQLVKGTFNEYMVVVYRKDRVHERGLAFRDEAHFRVWGKDFLPVQQDLFA